ncbi:hypothetical protein TBLA_0D03410 [Henningerozyma blattae CBS 6284]|uniref:Cyclin-like domain-containing protein n=1 Tax=Henningerozyma blattae (strain ATCC 34711 / CBS 6284 / DSM 70876 / NBRC 10599 / NRRL Y-10934 / UCD 77-7) TaxID=1071380 RepID=I2H389_HENB6|nr:hypothetical protein TBLA_0D03410 [Tetrapisispora blattae CBS 6284]CCH60841.1 hypothetical protein TBLA_0D03410 [Tetrapisispora blattae CBS 6284]
MSFESQIIKSRPFFNKQQIRRLQKHTINNKLNYEVNKTQILNKVNKICYELKFPRCTLETSIYFYQRYYLFNKFESEYCFIVGVSCILLSSKQMETVKKINEICSVALKLRNTEAENMSNQNAKINPEVLENFKKRVIQIEQRILESCCFDYRIYYLNHGINLSESLILIGKDLKVDKEVCKLGWIICYDVLNTELILILPGFLISFVILKISSEIFQLHYKESNYESPFFDTDKYSIRKDFSDEAYFTILNMYINKFDSFEIKNYNKISLSIETFMKLKEVAGEESGISMLSEDQLDLDSYINEIRDFNIKERRYVLDSTIIENEIK